jgi:hypothetical protein
MSRFFLNVSLLCCSACLVILQAKGADNPNAPKSTDKAGTVNQRLVRVDNITTSEVTGAIRPPIKCDEGGNIYLHTDESPVAAVHKISPTGERLVTFDATSDPNHKVDVASYFALEPGADALYQLVYPHEISRYIFAFGPDGTFKSAIKLNPGFAFMPTKVAVFPSGQFLVSGLEYDADKTSAMWPFTGIFDTNGKLLKELELEDDRTLHDMAASGDTRAAVAGNIHGNRAISNSEIEIGADGNAYLMRWTNPTIFYAISPGGEIVRRFTVDPGGTEFWPFAMHIYKNRIAILFGERDTDKAVMKIVDLEGNAIETYYVPMDDKKPDAKLSVAFACYTENPTHFIFIGGNDEGKMQLWLAEPR